MARISTEELPAPIDLSHYFSQAAQSKTVNPFKAFYRFFTIPGIGNLAGGLPNNNYFPFETLEAVAALPERFKPTPPKPVKPPAAKHEDPDHGPQTEGSRIVVPMVSPDKNVLSKIELKTSLQYGDAHGLPPLYAWVRQFTREHLHPNIPYKDGAEVIMTTGNTDGFAKTLEALMDPWREGLDPIEMRPAMLVEQFLYTPPALRAKVYRANIVPVIMDSQGIMASGPGGLEDVLENWDYSLGRRPHLLYTVTIGQNPTGGVLSVKRRKEIYEVCVKYDVIIIEDEPYWYLQYPSANPSKFEHQYRSDIVEAPLSDQDKSGTSSLSEKEPGSQRPRSSGYAFLDSLVPSFISIDYQGRVVRLDTFSKTVAPGCRLGWITAQPALIEKIYLSTQQTTQQPSGFVQSLIAQLILGTIKPSPEEVPNTNSLFNSLNLFGSAPPPETQNGWGTSGWVRWLEGLRGNYERRVIAMCTILDANKIRSTDRIRSSEHRAKRNTGTLTHEPWIHVRKQQIFEFNWPMGGMFAWLRLTLHTHPLAEVFPHKDLAAALWILLTHEPYLVLGAPGLLFSANDDIQMREGYACLRLCFAAADEAEIVPMTQRMVNGFHAFWDIERKDEIEELLKESPFMQAQLNSITF